MTIVKIIYTHRAERREKKEKEGDKKMIFNDIWFINYHINFPFLHRIINHRRSN